MRRAAAPPVEADVEAEASLPALADAVEEAPRGPFAQLMQGGRLEPDLVAVVLVYFVQGALGISRLASITDSCRPRRWQRPAPALFPPTLRPSRPLRGCEEAC